MLDNQTSAAVALKRPPGGSRSGRNTWHVYRGRGRACPGLSIIFAPCLKTWIGPLEPGLLVVMRVIPGRRSEAEATPESIFPDPWLRIPGSRPAAEPRNDWTKALPQHASPV